MHEDEAFEAAVKKVEEAREIIKIEGAPLGEPQ
jgi:hypothetical protein